LSVYTNYWLRLIQPAQPAQHLSIASFSVPRAALLRARWSGAHQLGVQSCRRALAL